MGDLDDCVYNMQQSHFFHNSNDIKTAAAFYYNNLIGIIGLYVFSSHKYNAQIEGTIVCCKMCVNLEPLHYSGMQLVLFLQKYYFNIAYVYSDCSND